MAEHVYEGMFILDSNRYQRDQAGVSGQVVELIGRFHGTVLASRLWEDRRLAYPIKGQRRGTYWLTYFKLDSSQLVGLNREVQINENILRHLFLKINDRIADAMVAHAKDAVPSQLPTPVRKPEVAAVAVDELEEEDDTE